MQPPDAGTNRQHAQHDLNLIAGIAADDLAAIERTRAQAQLDGCGDCRAIRADLLAIALATRALPAASAPRDFRLSPEQASRLRRTGWLGALLAPFASARSSAKPLATAFTTLGLAGVFVAVLLPGMFGGMAMSASPEAAPGAAGGPTVGGIIDVTASEAPAPQLGPMATAGSAEGQGTKDTAQATAVPVFGQTDGGDDRDLGSDGGRVDTSMPPTNILLVGSLGLLAAGLVLFGLRFAGRRLR